MAAGTDESAVAGSLEMTGGDRIVVSAHELGLRFGDRVLWDDLSFTLASGELLAVLGPNGTGKTSLIRILLGLLTPSAGSVQIEGKPPREQRRRIGYVPQQRAFDRDLALRGRDLVRLGIDGHRWGAGRLSRTTGAIAQVLADVGATGTQMDRLGVCRAASSSDWIAQAIVADPALYVDEPLFRLDLGQQTITNLLDDRRRTPDAGRLRHHDINPVPDGRPGAPTS